MDSDHTGSCEKSLPGMGLPRWMKKGPERYDFADYCTSPPTDDGFFHFGHTNYMPRQKATSVQLSQPVPECTSRKIKEFEGGNISMEKTTSMKPDFGNKFLTSKDCKSSETSTFFRTASSSSLVNLASSQAALLVLPSNLLSMKDTSGNNKTTENSLRTTGSDTQLAVFKHDFTDSAPTALENSIPRTIVTSADDYEFDRKKVKSKKSMSKFNGKLEDNKNPGTLGVPHDDVNTSANSTPAVSPACSPQIARRENPFFTGSSQNSNNNKSSGSWLFRSASSSQDSNKGRANFLYEAKNDTWKSNSPQPASNKPRFVPKPSELRELNFWSPTSM